MAASEEQLRVLMHSTLSASEELDDDSDTEIDGYDLAVAVADRLQAEGVGSPGRLPRRWVIKASFCAD